MRYLTVQTIRPNNSPCSIYFKTVGWSLSYYLVASTAFAVIKFASYKSETGNTTYDSNVTAGLKY
jgi:hypothetical protein